MAIPKKPLADRFPRLDEPFPTGSDLMASHCWKYDLLTERIKEMLLAPSCPSGMREVVADRKAVRASMEELARSYMGKAGDEAIQGLPYFNTWLNLRGGFAKD